MPLEFIYRLSGYFSLKSGLYVDFVFKNTISSVAKEVLNRFALNFLDKYFLMTLTKKFFTNLVDKFDEWIGLRSKTFILSLKIVLILIFFAALLYLASGLLTVEMHHFYNAQ